MFPPFRLQPETKALHDLFNLISDTIFSTALDQSVERKTFNLPVAVRAPQAVEPIHCR